MLSVVVLAKNEEDRIKACLESIKWADEIIFVDNCSTDKTTDIARKYTDKIIILKTNDFSELRNKAFEKTKGGWVLYIDADERVLLPLKEEIQRLVVSENKSAYAISRKNIIFGKEVYYGPYKHDWVVRLLKREKFKKWVGEVHEYATFEGDLGYTVNSFLHLTHRDIDQIVLKSLEWSKIDAKLRLKKGHPKMSGWRFIRILITELLNQGVIRRGFFGGTVGVVDSLMQTFSLLVTYIRLWQMQQSNLKEGYNKIDRRLIESNFFSYD